MAINKRARSIKIQLSKDHIMQAEKFEETSKKVFMYATNDELQLNSNKKIVSNGNK